LRRARRCRRVFTLSSSLRTTICAMRLTLFSEVIS
jgi:hypothetical protein